MIKIIGSQGLLFKGIGKVQFVYTALAVGGGGGCCCFLTQSWMKHFGLDPKSTETKGNLSTSFSELWIKSLLFPHIVTHEH